jgi:competence protein ComEC
MGAVVLAAWITWEVASSRNSDVLTVTALAVGDGEANIVRGHGADGVLLVDAGTNRNLDAGQTVVDAVANLGFGRVTGLAVSHGNFDHYSAGPTVNQTWPLRHFWTSPYVTAGIRDKSSAARLLDQMPAAEPLRAGDRFPLGDSSIEILWPPEDLKLHWADNDTSLVVRATAAGQRVLIPGDIEKHALRALVAEHRAGTIDLHSQVLMAPHHGSVLPHDTEEFLRCVRPEYLIVSSAQVRPKMMDLMRQRFPDCRVLTCGQRGAVTVHVGQDGRLTLQSFREESAGVRARD